MTANRRLGAQMGIPEDVLQAIDRMHDANEKFICQALRLKSNPAQVHELLTMADFDLQVMWGFPMDRSFHTLVKDYEFRRKWYGRKFKCLETGEVFTIPITVRETDFYVVGNGGIDVGRYSSYYRIAGNVTEVFEEEGNV